MKAKKLKENACIKTEFILFDSHHLLNKCSTKAIPVCEDSNDLQNCIQIFGAFLDDNLNFMDHIKQKMFMFNFFKIKSIGRYVTKEGTYVLYLSLVIPT